MFTNFEIMSKQTHSPVNFFFLVDRITLKDRNRLKIFIRDLFKKQGKKPKAINYVFCTDQFLLSINKKYLQHDYYTDIITFDLSDNEKELQGEIYISVDRVKENAKQLGLSITSELHRVIFHGAIHLCGFNDKKREEKAKMREMENQLLDKYFH
jgi:probable rRNA maturation factor